MKKLNWVEKNLTWWDGEGYERAEILENITSDELTYSEIEGIYENDYYLKDEEGCALDLDDIKDMINSECLELEGKKWSEVKEILENFVTVDADNVGEDGACIVDFTDRYSDFSINGQIIRNENETIIKINDNAIIYKNN